MNKKQKEVQQAFLNAEKEVLEQLKKNYQDALDEINTKIAILLGRDDADMSHVMYQVVYQETLKKQVESALNTLQANEFETISDYLAKSYEDGYIGTMYDIQGQGIPIIMPMDQEQVVQAIQHETKLSEGLYKALGKDVKVLSKQIAGEITRGISSGQMYSEIARNIAGYAGISRNKAMRIARTEGHRIQCKATMDAQFKAKEKGADVVKQWDSTLDKRTRASHRKLDGQIRELDEEFEANGHFAMMPGGFNKASEDINCRCALLQRARWALDESELETLKQRAEYFDLDKTEDFADYKKKYLKAVDEDILENSVKSSKIELEKDIVIHRSVGAKAKNHKVKLPDGSYASFAEGSRITNVTTIAGKGRDRQIDIVDVLVSKYGGNPEEWQKKKGIGYVDIDGESYKAEVHWYEEQTIGRVEFKIKSRNGEWIIDDE